MSLIGKLVSELEINAAAEKFYEIFKDQCFQVPNITPRCIQQVEIHGTNWDGHGHGSIKSWYYTIDGKAEVFKERVEFHDDKLLIVLDGVGGDVFKNYKSFKPAYQFVPKDRNHCQAILSIEYEKLHHGSPDPHKYIDLMIGITNDIGSHIK
ncbi:hypothetical protein IC582_024430 [Cucumis melo]|uniref:MLP-like protein 329 n=1 Tax=Cucumis melo TaxID=3656 RepID=P93095_CUCME|nr:MLP-like protein 329 [Cucumis melo]CAA94433.1 unknown [Cucumis melo]